MVCRGEERGPTGKRTFLNILAYDEKAKAYTEYGISSLGESEYSTGGSIAGNKRTFVKDLDSDVKGMVTKLRYIEVQVYRALLESNAAFFAAQMTAMDTATKNSGDMIANLTLYMNKVRQAAITREIIEVVSGAEAL